MIACWAAMPTTPGYVIRDITGLNIFAVPKPPAPWSLSTRTVDSENCTQYKWYVNGSGGSTTIYTTKVNLSDLGQWEDDYMVFGLPELSTTAALEIGGAILLVWVIAFGIRRVAAAVLNK